MSRLKLKPAAGLAYTLLSFWTLNSTLRTVFGAVADAVPAIVAFGAPSFWRSGAPAGVTTVTTGVLASKLKVTGTAGVGTSVLPVTPPRALSSPNTCSV